MILLAENAHDALKIDEALSLGELHWYLLKAATAMRDARYRDTPTGQGRFVRTTTTDFGKEVGRDEINWWVFKKESDRATLAARTRAALEAAQMLKRAAVRLRESHHSDRYDDLVGGLRRFAQFHSVQITALRDYAVWLYERDPLAPAILYSYRVWGDTRRGDRWHVAVTAATPSEEGRETIFRLAEVVLGLLGSFRLYTFERASQEIVEDMYADENFGEVSLEAVARRASSLTLAANATYFEEVRDSLRNVLLDIDTFEEQQTLLQSDAFWRSFIEKVIVPTRPESDLWDFKETLPMWHTAAQAKEANSIRFSEDVASFANERGGVLIVGVTDDRRIVGIGTARDVENRIKSTSDVLAKRLVYPRPITRTYAVRMADGRGVEQTCLVVVAAQACEVVGVLGQHDSYTYPVRRGTGVARVGPASIETPKRQTVSPFSLNCCSWCARTTRTAAWTAAGFDVSTADAREVGCFRGSAHQNGISRCRTLRSTSN